MTNKTQLAKEIGVARKTLYAWIEEGCPDPDEDRHGFDKWVKFRQEQRDATAGEWADATDLKAAKLRADVVSKWARVDEYRDALIATQETADWEESQDILAEYRSELQHVAVAEDVRARLNAILAKASATIKARADNAEARRDKRLNELRALVMENTQAT